MAGIDWVKVGGVALVGVGAADMAFGNTNTPILPTPIANLLTQQMDVVLIAAGLLLIFVEF